MPHKPSPWRVIIESMFYVINKQGMAVPFILNDQQAYLDAHLTGRDLIPKARQLGVSTYFLGRFAAKCLTKDNVRAVIISHEEEATKRLLARAQYFITHLTLHHNIPIDGEFDISADTQRLSKAEIAFKETGSWFYIGTAGADTFGRGDTITDLHCSEYAHWDNPFELSRGLFTSVPQKEDGGEIFIESTGNGIANDFANRVRDAMSGKSYWAVHFFPWQEEPTYTKKLNWRESKDVLSNLREELDEPRLKEVFRLTAGQIAWRRERIADMNGDIQGFRQEFPMTVDECFQASGDTIFDRVVYAPLTAKEWEEHPGLTTSWAVLKGHPREGMHYVIGADPSGGKGQDSAVIQVGCIETNEQVAVWRSTSHPPDTFAHVLMDWSDRFNKAFAIVEANNHGLVVLHEMRREKFPISRLFKYKAPDSTKKEAGLMDMGYQTTSRTKPLAVGRCRTLLAEGYAIHDPVTYMELQSFVETPEGKFEAQVGSHDDHVMALVMLAAGMKKATTKADVDRQKKEPEVAYVDPFSLEAILSDVDTGRGQTASDIWRQHEENTYEGFFAL